MRPPTYLLFVLFALSGCGIPLTPKAMEESEEGVYLKQTFDRLAAKDFAPIEAALDPEVRNPSVRQTLEKMAALLPTPRPSSVEFLGWHVERIVGQDRRVDLTMELGYPSRRWLLVTAQLRGEPGKFRIWGFHVQPMSNSLSEINAFTFSGKSSRHLLWLMATLLAVGLTAYALVRCLRTNDLKRKWLWALFISAGVCAFSLNWTTGEFSVSPLQLNLFSASIFRNGYVGPWILTFCLPVGAVVFLATRRRLTPSHAVPPVIR